jgi:hypothetical protein
MNKKGDPIEATDLIVDGLASKERWLALACIGPAFNSRSKQGT